MDDKLKIWSSVGSAGILNQADLAKVTLHQSIVQLGVDIVSPPTQEGTPAARPAVQPGLGIPTVQAVARYNVTPVDGLFFQQVPSRPFHYGLRLRYLGHVTARFVEVDLQSGAETVIINFDSASFPASPFFQVQTAFAQHFEGVVDFVKKAYYVEATLTAPTLIVGHPAAISIVKVIAEQTQF
jgi:hypothetical protein